MLGEQREFSLVYFQAPIPAFAFVTCVCDAAPLCPIVGKRLWAAVSHRPAPESLRPQPATGTFPHRLSCFPG